MRNNSKGFAPVLILILVLIVGIGTYYFSAQKGKSIFLPSSNPSIIESPVPEALPDSKPKSPVKAQLDVVSAGSVGNTATLKLTIVSDIDGPTSLVGFTLPGGLSLIDGIAEQKVSLKKGESQTFQIKVRLLEMGEQKIMAGASIDLGNGNGIRGGFDALFLEVGKTETTWQREPKVTSTSPAGLIKTVPVC